MYQSKNNPQKSAQSSKLSQQTKNPPTSNPKTTQQNSDYQRLLNLCNSYGLNQQQTQQLLIQFQKGQSNRSNQSFQSSNIMNSSQLSIIDESMTSMNESDANLQHQEHQYSQPHSQKHFQQYSQQQNSRLSQPKHSNQTKMPDKSRQNHQNNQNNNHNQPKPSKQQPIKSPSQSYQKLSYNNIHNPDLISYHQHEKQHSKDYYEQYEQQQSTSQYAPTNTLHNINYNINDTYNEHKHQQSIIMIRQDQMTFNYNTQYSNNDNVIESNRVGKVVVENNSNNRNQILASSAVATGMINKQSKDDRRHNLESLEKLPGERKQNLDSRKQSSLSFASSNSHNQQYHQQPQSSHQPQQTMKQQKASHDSKYKQIILSLQNQISLINEQNIMLKQSNKQQKQQNRHINQANKQILQRIQEQKYVNKEKSARIVQLMKLLEEEKIKAQKYQTQIISMRKNDSHYTSSIIKQKQLLQSLHTFQHHKQQQNNIINGLKDTITQLTAILKDKDQQNRQLQNKLIYLYQKFQQHRQQFREKMFYQSSRYSNNSRENRNLGEEFCYNKEVQALGGSLPRSGSRSGLRGGNYQNKCSDDNGQRDNIKGVYYNDQQQDRNLRQCDSYQNVLLKRQKSKKSIQQSNSPYQPHAKKVQKASNYSQPYTFSSIPKQVPLIPKSSNDSTPLPLQPKDIYSNIQIKDPKLMNNNVNKTKKLSPPFQSQKQQLSQPKKLYPLQKNPQMLQKQKQNHLLVETSSSIPSSFNNNTQKNKRSKVDIKKYKGMIQELRNSYTVNPINTNTFNNGLR